MASWDVFHADSLELERGLTRDAIRAALAGGALRDDDLVRPAGTTAAWIRLGDLPELNAPAGPPAPGVTAPERQGNSPGAPFTLTDRARRRHGALAYEPATRCAN